MHNIILIIIINPFCQGFNVSMCSAQQKISLITCVSDIMQFDNLLHIFFNCTYLGSTSYKLELLNLGHLPAQSQQ